jgi:hypothetical protein
VVRPDRPDRDERQIGPGYGRGGVVGEAQTPIREMGLDELPKGRLVEWDPPRCERV